MLYPQVFRDHLRGTQRTKWHTGLRQPAEKEACSGIPGFYPAPKETRSRESEAGGQLHESPEGGSADSRAGCAFDPEAARTGDFLCQGGGAGAVSELLRTLQPGLHFGSFQTSLEEVP